MLVTDSPTGDQHLMISRGTVLAPEGGPDVPEPGEAPDHSFVLEVAHIHEHALGLATGSGRSSQPRPHHTVLVARVHGSPC